MHNFERIFELNSCETDINCHIISQYIGYGPAGSGGVLGGGFSRGIRTFCIAVEFLYTFCRSSEIDAQTFFL